MQPSLATNLTLQQKKAKHQNNETSKRRRKTTLLYQAKFLFLKFQEYCLHFNSDLVEKGRVVVFSRQGFVRHVLVIFNIIHNEIVVEDTTI